MVPFAKKCLILVLSLLTYSALSQGNAQADHDHHGAPPTPTDIPGNAPADVEKTSESQNNHVDNRNALQEAAQPTASVNFEPTPNSFEPLPIIQMITPMAVPSVAPVVSQASPDVFSASTLAAPPAAESVLAHDHGQMMTEASPLMEGNHSGHLAIDVNSIRAVSGGLQIRYDKTSGVEQSAADHVHFQLVVNGVPQEEKMDRDFDGRFMFPMEKIPQGEFEIRGYIVNKDHQKIDNTEFAKKFSATSAAKKEVAVAHAAGKESVLVQEKLNASKLNREPVLQPIGPQFVAPGEKMSVQLVATDPEGDQLFFEASPLPEGATFDTATGLFKWSPKKSESLEITFSVSDGKNVVSETAPVTALI